MPEELCQVSPKSQYVSLALHSDPSPFEDGGGDEKIANHGCHHQLMMVAPAQGCRGGHASRSPSLLHLI